MLGGSIKILIGLIIFVTGYLGWAYYHTVDIGERRVSVIIKSGDSFNAVAAHLIESGVVDSRLMLYYPARLRSIDKKLVPGRYDFTGENSCASVLDKLAAGDFLKVRVTVYEGAPIWKVASILANSELGFDSTYIANLNEDSTFLAKVGVPTLEGYLYPETYFIPWGTDPKDVMGEMVEMFRSKTEDIWPDTIPGGLNREQTITLASIIEAEAKLDREKPIISSVYHNRLRRNMRLDADPTVIYGLGGLERPLYRRDLNVRTPYNTYRMKGLPPTPINSPGLEAIKAAIHPADTDYLFFVADGTGGHRFSRTNDEHNRARYEIKQEMRSNQ